MAASDNQPPSGPFPSPSTGPGACLAEQTLRERLEEEVARAERQRTPLSCLFVAVEDLREIEQQHGRELAELVCAYVGLTLRRELRRYDRVGRPGEREEEYLVVLPGADGPRGELVARRALSRLSAVKIEAQGQRRALPVAVGIATWREGLTAQAIVDRARTAAGRRPPEPPSLSPALPERPLGFRADAARA